MPQYPWNFRYSSGGGTMAEKLKSISCDPMCGFMVQSHDEKEAMNFAKAHLKNVHKQTMSDDEVRKKMKDV